MKNGEHPFGAIERMIERWWRGIPHLPKGGQKWLAQNSWWIVIIGLVLLAIGVLQALDRAYIYTAPQTSLGIVTSGYIGWAIVINFVYIFFTLVEILILALAIKPLKAVAKEGWSLLFMYGLVVALAVVVQAILTLDIVTFVIGIIFGGIGLAIFAYFLFEMRDHFAHTVTPKKVKAADKK